MVEKTENDFDTVASSSRRANKVKPATTTRLAAIATSPAANKTENPPRQTPYEHLRSKALPAPFSCTYENTDQPQDDKTARNTELQRRRATKAAEDRRRTLPQHEADWNVVAMEFNAPLTKISSSQPHKFKAQVYSVKIIRRSQDVLTSRMNASRPIASLWQTTTLEGGERGHLSSPLHQDLAGGGRSRKWSWADGDTGTQGGAKRDRQAEVSQRCITVVQMNPDQVDTNTVSPSSENAALRATFLLVVLRQDSAWRSNPGIGGVSKSA
ncbi:hypothetical protein PPTG_07971 [Phytophthora nicotianae INRA-310]|uniref:Uncharacterized protein n=1 Tax=Phytophthora nicotianae (strain INRA-310) TaxID=761204 RepID=W2QPD2_PHYN3|nr:hypothetical protein PPTG_07971 [Phytophthora nicotianae INRA-310]ETN14354.1 hypothetical protein PPTG_07971 [Phytophthora nicotianae INRA-310]